MYGCVRGCQGRVQGRLLGRWRAQPRAARLGLDGTREEDAGREAPGRELLPPPQVRPGGGDPFAVGKPLTPPLRCLALHT